MFDHLQMTPKPNDAKWAGAFDRMDGGLITLAVTSAEISDPELDYFSGEEFADMSDAERQRVSAIQGVFGNFETVATGLDISEDGSRIGLRVRIAAKEPSEARNKFVHAKTLLRLIRQEWEQSRVNEDGESLSPADSIANQMVGQLIDRMKLQLIENPSDSWEVYASSTMDTTALGEMLVSGIMSEMMSPGGDSE